MRFLLDQMNDTRLVGVLESLGHQATHTGDAGYGRYEDQELAVVAREYDIFLTQDLHRQEPEWIAVHRALMSGEIKVLRVRLPKPVHGVNRDPFLDLVRSLTERMEDWLELFASGYCFVTISSSGEKVRARTAEDVREMMANRTTRQSDMD